MVVPDFGLQVAGVQNASRPDSLPVVASTCPCTFTAVLDGHSGTLSAEMGAWRLKDHIAMDPGVWNVLGEPSPAPACLRGEQREPMLVQQTCLRFAWSEPSSWTPAHPQVTTPGPAALAPLACVR